MFCGVAIAVDDAFDGVAVVDDGITNAITVGGVVDCFVVWR